MHTPAAELPRLDRHVHAEMAHQPDNDQRGEQGHRNACRACQQSSEPRGEDHGGAIQPAPRSGSNARVAGSCPGRYQDGPGRSIARGTSPVSPMAVAGRPSTSARPAGPCSGLGQAPKPASRTTKPWEQRPGPPRPTTPQRPCPRSSRPGLRLRRCHTFISAPRAPWPHHPPRPRAAFPLPALPRLERLLPPAL